MREGIDHVTRRRFGLGITRFIFIFACHTSDRDAQSYNHTCRLVRAESVALQIVLCESAVANTPNTTGFITHRLHSFNERNAHLQLRRRFIGEIDTRLRRAGQELRARMQRPKTELAKQRTRVRVKRTLNPESLSERRPGQRHADALASVFERSFEQHCYPSSTVRSMHYVCKAKLQGTI